LGRPRTTGLNLQWFLYFESGISRPEPVGCYDFPIDLWGGTIKTCRDANDDGWTIYDSGDYRLQRKSRNGAVVGASSEA
jgi:hypothetical protein